MILLNIKLFINNCNFEIICPNNIDGGNIEIPSCIYFSQNNSDIICGNIAKDYDNNGEKGAFSDILDLLSSEYDIKHEKSWLTYKNGFYSFHYNKDTIKLSGPQIIAKYIKEMIKQISEKYNQNIEEIIIASFVSNYINFNFYFGWLASSFIEEGINIKEESFYHLIDNEENNYDYKRSIIDMEDFVNSSCEWCIELIKLYADWIQDEELYWLFNPFSKYKGYFCDFLKINKKNVENADLTKILNYHLPECFYKLYTNITYYSSQSDIHKKMLLYCGIPDKYKNNIKPLKYDKVYYHDIIKSYSLTDYSSNRLLPTEYGYYSKIIVNPPLPDIWELDETTGIIYTNENRRYNHIKLSKKRYSVQEMKSSYRKDIYSTKNKLVVDRTVKAILNKKVVKTSIKYFIENHIPRIILKHSILFYY